MVYKSRVIDKTEYLVNLQKEYICTAIRYQIYKHDFDKKHYYGVMQKKRNKIDSIADKGYATIFTDEKVKAMIVSEIVPEFGFPNMIYNERVKPDEVKKQYKFPYSGTLVRVGDRIGITDYVDFDKYQVYVQFNENESSTPIHYKKVVRLSLEESDRYYYYSTGTFVTDHMAGVYPSIGYDHKTDEVNIFDKRAKMRFDIKTEQVRRLLNGLTRLDSK